MKNKGLDLKKVFRLTDNKVILLRGNVEPGVLDELRTIVRKHINLSE